MAAVLSMDGLFGDPCAFANVVIGPAATFTDTA